MTKFLASGRHNFQGNRDLWIDGVSVESTGLRRHRVQPARVVRDLSGLPSEANADDLTKLANNRNPQVDLWNGRNSEKAFTVECE